MITIFVVSVTLVVVAVFVITMLFVSMSSQVACCFHDCRNRSVDTFFDFAPLLAVFLAVHQCVVRIEAFFNCFQVGCDGVFCFLAQVRISRKFAKRCNHLTNVMQFAVGSFVVFATDDASHFFQLGKRRSEGVRSSVVVMMVVVVAMVVGNRLIRGSVIAACDGDCKQQGECAGQCLLHLYFPVIELCPFGLVQPPVWLR